MVDDDVDDDDGVGDGVDDDDSDDVEDDDGVDVEDDDGVDDDDEVGVDVDDCVDEVGLTHVSPAFFFGVTPSGQHLNGVYSHSGIYSGQSVP